MTAQTPPTPPATRERRLWKLFTVASLTSCFSSSLDGRCTSGTGRLEPEDEEDDMLCLAVGKS